MAEQDPAAITLTDLRKSFKLPHEKGGGIKQLFVSFYKKGGGYEIQSVLKGLTFDIKQGEFFGIVGRNGSGKSTLLKLLAGIYTPTSGDIQVRGRLTPFIELGVGFNPELTGRENVFLNGALLGFSKKQMQALYPEIVAFAELERFMDQKLKNYSSGMQVRLAFSIAIQSDADIFVFDEVLAVGDAIFQKKCYNYFKELKKRKKTVVFVSHDTSALQEYCDRGVLVEQGNIILEGKIDKVVNTYIDLLNETEEKAAPSAEEVHRDKRWGTGAIIVDDIQIGKPGKGKSSIFDDKDEHIEVTVTYKAKEAIERPVFGFTLNDPTGQVVFQSNTLWQPCKTENMTPGQIATVIWTIPNVFNTGTLQLSPAVADSIGSVVYDWLEDAISFKIRKKNKSHGQINVAYGTTVSYK
jgi:ABC-2 type transport system ATP-binding protein